MSASRLCRINWRPLVVMGILTSVLLGSISCTSGPADQAYVSNPVIISYAAAGSWLRGLDPSEADEQLRDWASTGLVSQLELDTEQLRNTAYDTIPVRDAAFVDLSRQPVGPGRSLLDGHGILHVLVPYEDPHKARTIGLLLDQYRADAGVDPAQVQIHQYRIHPENQTIELTPDKPAPTSEVRSAYGFVTMRVDEPQGLRDFLARSHHLSSLEVRGSQVWAGGWIWPDVPSVPLDNEDISAIQRGYLQPAPAPRPGFSLDPGPPTTKEDLLAIIPGLSPELADRLVSHDSNASPSSSTDSATRAINEALFDGTPPPADLTAMGLPSDRTQLWALYVLLTGHSPYSQARNDGQLEGTKVGMTLFYTDKVAKDWVGGVGSGVPSKAVSGFVADPDAANPWSECTNAGSAEGHEYGRLWFGQNDPAFTFDDHQINIGAQATRLFIRSEDKGGTEVEPSFSFGRGMRWWDHHYQAVADYEPQYQRLDQIMRWSSALDWLVSKTQARLPQLGDADIRSDLRFKDWYAQHDELRERSPIDFVTPPSATHEAVLSQPSAVYQDCGLLGIVGGVSLGDLIEREGGRSYHADLPEALRRGGPLAETSHFDPALGTGKIDEVSLESNGQVTDTVQRTFSTAADHDAVVEEVANGRRVIPFGHLKVWRADTAPRRLKVEFAAEHGQVSERVEYQGQDLGELTAHKDAVTTRQGIDVVTIVWRRGLVDHIRQALESIQDRLVNHPSTDLPPVTDGVLYSYQNGNDLPLYKVGGGDSSWLSITNEEPTPGDDPVFRLGAPRPGTGDPEFFYAKFSPPPDLPPISDGWLDITPAAGDHSAQAHLAGPPDPRDPTVEVNTPDGTTSTVAEVGDHLRVRLDDPILGLHGSTEGAALLRDFPRVAEAIRAASDARDGLLRGVRLGDDGVALAGDDKVTVIAEDHPWARRVLQAFGYDPSVSMPVFRLEGTHVFHVDRSPLIVAAGSERRTTLGEVWDTTPGNMYLHRSMLTLDNGVIITDALNRGTRVRVREATIANVTAQSAAIAPDIRIHGNAEWWRIPNINTSSTPSSTTNQPSPDSGFHAPPAGQILLVCPDADNNLPGCTE